LKELRAGLNANRLSECRHRFTALNVPFDWPKSKAPALLEKREMPESHAHVSGGLMGEFGDKFARMPSESASAEVRVLSNLTLVGPEGTVRKSVRYLHGVLRQRMTLRGRSPSPRFN